MKYSYTLFVFMILITWTAACASSPQREKKILETTREEIKTYEEYLVKPEQYTTNGATYHEKYKPYLIGVARTVTTDLNLSVQKNSIGFYFDKKENRREKLFLGLDIFIPVDPSLKGASYEHIASAIMEAHLKDILAVVNSCATVLEEKEVVGAVIGFMWDSAGSRESISIWVDKTDAAMLENMKLTLKEVVIRSFITNTAGKIIRLPL